MAAAAVQKRERMSGNGVGLRSIYVAILAAGREVTSGLPTPGQRMVRLNSGMATMPADLRRTMPQVGASVMGHGVLICGLEKRPRVGKHLGLPSAA